VPGGGHGDGVRPEWRQWLVSATRKKKVAGWAGWATRLDGLADATKNRKESGLPLRTRPKAENE
jgi:hypothetical protein